MMRNIGILISQGVLMEMIGPVFFNERSCICCPGNIAWTKRGLSILQYVFWKNSNALTHKELFPSE